MVSPRNRPQPRDVQVSVLDLKRVERPLHQVKAPRQRLLSLRQLQPPPQPAHFGTQAAPPACASGDTPFRRDTPAGPSQNPPSSPHRTPPAPARRSVAPTETPAAESPRRSLVPHTAICSSTHRCSSSSSVSGSIRISLASATTHDPLRPSRRHLRPPPHRIQLLRRHPRQRRRASRRLFHAPEPPPKLRVRPPQRRLRIHPEMPRQVHRRKQHVPQLFRLLPPQTASLTPSPPPAPPSPPAASRSDPAASGQSNPTFAAFAPSLAPPSSPASPAEPPPAATRLRPHPWPPFSSRLISLPVPQHRVRILRLHPRKDMRMPTHQLLVRFAATSRISKYPASSAICA